LLKNAQGKDENSRLKVESPLLGSRTQTLDVSSFPHGGNLYAFAHALGSTPEELLDLSASINPLGAPLSARRAYHRAFPKIVSYPEPYAERLTLALSEYHEVDPANILVGNGSTQLIYSLARFFCPRRILLVAPLFSEHAAAFRFSSATVEHFFLRPPSFLLHLDRLARLLIAKTYDVLVLTNPNSPTGALMRREQVEELARLCRQNHIRLLVDETFIDWAEEESVKRLAAQDETVIVLRSLTKFFALPGLRVGYIIASPRMIRRLRASVEPWSVNTVAQEVGVACVQDQRFVEHSRAFMYKERAWLYARLDAIPGLRVFPSWANFFLLQTLVKEITAPYLAERLAREKVLIRVCANFAGLGKRFFRVAVRTRTENRRLLEALCFYLPRVALADQKKQRPEDGLRPLLAKR